MITDPELGTIEFVHNERSKHIRVRILPSGLKVTLPMRASQEEAMAFINSIRSKLIQKQEKLERGLQKSNILIDEKSQLQTLTFVVKANPCERKNIYFSLKNNTLHIEYPSDVDCSDVQTQQHFWNGISYFLRKEAKRLLPGRTLQLADKYGFTFSDVKIQSSKSRWGSCSGVKSINLSLYLMLLPAHLIDYVILHELCHTKEMNHGDKFWRWMDKVTDDKSKALRAELKNYHMPS
ncbi:MAG: SprT family zinc-dependent metalloprotease [Bacteroidota bacterium]|nr:SprT family zinc-dependent metalloprotease [Bacteroidota bacterium]